MILTFGIFLILAFTLAVSGQVVFTTLPSNQEVQEGQNATFDCTVSNGGTPLVVIWRLRREGSIILQTAASAPLSGSGGVILGPNNGSPSTVTSVQRSLNGITVSCVGRVDTFTAVEQTEPPGNLSVKFPPEFSINSSQLTAVVERANEYTYRFMLTANPIPAVFTWMKDSAELSSTSRISLTADSITIGDVLRSDAGLYTVSTGASATANFTLDVQYPPSLTNVGLTPRTVTLGQALTIHCTSTPGNPPSTSNVTITFDSRQLNASNGMLTISSVRSTDAGIYTCTASNSVGISTVTIEVKVVVADSFPVSCGTVCAVVTPVVLIGAVLCCVAVLGIILCYCYLCKKRPGDMRTKPERLSEKEEKEVELT